MSYLLNQMHLYGYKLKIVKTVLLKVMMAETSTAYFIAFKYICRIIRHPGSSYVYYMNVSYSRFY